MTDEDRCTSPVLAILSWERKTATTIGFYHVGMEMLDTKQSLGKCGFLALLCGICRADITAHMT